MPGAILEAYTLVKATPHRSDVSADDQTPGEIDISDLVNGNEVNAFYLYSTGDDVTVSFHPDNTEDEGILIVADAPPVAFPFRPQQIKFVSVSASATLNALLLN